MTNLFGEPGAEVMQFSAAAVYEVWCDDGGEPDESLRIEEWTSVGLSRVLHSARRILEDLDEALSDDAPEEAADTIGRAFADPEVVAAFEAARAVLAAKLDDGWRQADKLIATHIVTWDEDGEPLLDGEPMYVRRADHGFRWIGSGVCDACGGSLADHQAVQVLKRGAGPFGGDADFELVDVAEAARRMPLFGATFGIAPAETIAARNERFAAEILGGTRLSGEPFDAITVGEFMERLDHRISRADAVASLGHTVADPEGGEP